MSILCNETFVHFKKHDIWSTLFRLILSRLCPNLFHFCLKTAYTSSSCQHLVFSLVELEVHQVGLLCYVSVRECSNSAITCSLNFVIGVLAFASCWRSIYVFTKAVPISNSTVTVPLQASSKAWWISFHLIREINECFISELANNFRFFYFPTPLPICN